MDSYVPRDKIADECKALRDQEGFDCLSCLTGIDRADCMEVVYHLFSYKEKKNKILKVKLEKREGEMPSLASVSNIWPSADWMERETYDLFGIKFLGHPDLKRILLPDDWVGHPLLKDYKEGDEYQEMSTIRKFYT